MHAVGLLHLACSNCGASDTATLLAAIASIAVAVATFAVVVVTYRAASAANRAARATEGLLAAQLAPRLIDAETLGASQSDLEPAPAVSFGGREVLRDPSEHVVVTVDDDETVGFCSVPVRNVGAGLAQLRSAWVEVRLRGAVAPRVSTTIESWAASKRFLPGGEATRIDFTISVQLDEEVVRAFPYAIKIGAGITLHVLYTAAESAEEIETTFVLARPRPNEPWRVSGVFHSDLPESPQYPTIRQASSRGAAGDNLRRWPWRGVAKDDG